MVTGDLLAVDLVAVILVAAGTDGPQWLTAVLFIVVAAMFAVYVWRYLKR